MKFTPIMIFVFILVVLACSILFGNTIRNLYATPSPQRSKEGFLNHEYADNSPFKADVMINYYSPTRTLDKLYDNMYYDYVSGTVMVLYGSQYTLEQDMAKDADIVAKTVAKTNADAAKTVADNEATAATNAHTSSPTSANLTTKTAKVEAKRIADLAADTAKTQLETAKTAFQTAWRTTHTGNITGYRLIRRDGTAEDYTTTSGVSSYVHPNSKNTSISSSYTSLRILNQSEIDTYEILYIPWDKETYIHIIHMNSVGNSSGMPRHLRTYVYDAKGGRIASYNGAIGVSYDPIETGTIVRSTYSRSVQARTNNTSVITSYSQNESLFQLCKDVHYNAKNGDVVVKQASNQIGIYLRPNLQNSGTLLYESLATDSNNVPVVSTTIEDVDGFSSGVMDTEDKVYTVLYISNRKRTILMSLTHTSSQPYDNVMAVHNIMFFDGNQKRFTTDPTTTSGSSTGTGTGTNTGSEKKDEYLNEYYRLLLGLMGTSDGGLSNLPITNDYMLKTQIVPPVCPTCPSCPANHTHDGGVCSQCGGKGGAGTQTGNGNSNGNSNDDGVVDLLKSTGSGATNLARDVGSGATNLARETATGTVELAKDTVGGTVGLAKEVVGGTVGLAREAGSGIANTLGKMNPTVVSNTQESGSSGSELGSGTSSAGNGAGSNVSTGSDYTSYFGALPPKGGNYIPITADFSQFGR